MKQALGARVVASLLAVLALVGLLASCASGGQPATESAAAATPVPAGPVIKVQTGHAFRINALAITPDGRRIVTGSEDQSIKVWDAETGKELRTLVGHASGISDVDVSASGKLAISGGSWDGTVRLWDLDSGTELSVIPAHNKGVYSVAMSPDGTTAVSGGQNEAKTHEIVQWNLRNSSRVRTLTSTGGAPLDLAFAPDGKSFASASEDGSVTIWPMATLSVQRVIRAHQGKALCVAYSSDGTLLASGGEDGVVRLWDPSTGKQTRELKASYGKAVSVVFGSATTLLAAAYGSGSLRIWDTSTGASGASFSNPRNSREPWTRVAMSGDGTLLAAAGEGNTLCMWDLSGSGRTHTVGRFDEVVSLAASPASADVALATWAAAGTWDLREARFVRVQDTRSINARGVAYVGTSLFTLTAQDGRGSVSLWDTTVGGPAKATFRGMVGSVLRFAISRDGSRVAAADQNGPVFLWEVGKNEPTFTLEGPKGKAHPSTLAFSPDGRILASCATDKILRTWDAASGKSLQTSYFNEALRALAFSPDGSAILLGEGDGNLVLRTLQGSAAQTFAGGHRQTVTAIVFASDGRSAFSGAHDWTLCRWDLATGKLATRFVGHTGAIFHLALADDGRRLVSAAADGTVRFWNAETGELLYSAVVSSTGEYLAWTPEGYYGGSESMAREYVYVQDGDQVSSIDQYHELLYRPDLVAAKGRDGKLPEGVASASLTRILSGDGAPPRVEIVEPASGDRDSRELVLKLRLVDRGGGIGKIVIALDGMPVVLSEGGRGLSVSGTGEAADTGMLLEARVSLRGGENLVEVSAYNKAGSVESARVSRSYRVPETAAGKPRLAMLLVAVDKYRDGSLRLAHSVDDAGSFAQSMTSAAAGLYREVSVQQLLDAEVTRAGFDASFDALAGTVSPEDVFLLYFAGHGVTNEEDGEYYFLPVDFRYRDRASIAEQGISKSVILDNLLKVKADKTILLFDTCNSGSFLATPASRGLSEKTAVDRLKRAIGRAMIVASSDTQVALEGYQGHGVFTWSLLEGIGGKADGDRNGYVSVKELSSWVESTVPDITYATWGYEQVPQSLLPREDFPLVPAVK